MWEEMKRLYSRKWLAQEGEAFDDNDKPTKNFLLWCNKTEALTNDQWRTGLDILRDRVEKNASNEIDNWPPAGYAEFIGICKHSSSPNGINGAAYRVFKSNKALVDKTKLEARKEESKKQMSSIKNIMGMK
jgi:hypothetical protein